ncbi:MAG: cytochrome c, partial [Verrucomicrobia bacterium]|nr:cytochrome c [Verrucomicrobiota bacterium]
GSAASADVTANWSTHCASCHGKDGKAQTKAGRMAGALDLTDAGNQAKFTDEKAFLSIKDGQKDGTKEKMKPFKDKLTDDEIKALIAFVRTLKK